ncbi:hypothetical protein EAX62_10520 [Tessaracoccus antarcticus]|uniref:Uncharacterized protein n=2 Tax=Tessaracoccus antarcticus TaxID=2479848 RepID=A0A3M0G519_9ACTN|nr:hypothetical protein EAX62_10520 [Tessaracoccus antarcticus]
MESLLAARQELGPGMEPALVDSFAQKIIAEVQRQTWMEHQKPVPRPESNGGRLAIGIVSLVMAIPLTAIALGNGSVFMAIVCWIGIVMVNFAFAFRQRGNP